MKSNIKREPKTFVTSDLHFGHTKILEYEKETRPFDSIEEMNEGLIKNWNSVVSEEDDVYMLGDIFMGSIDLIDDIMPRLNGNKHLIRGNHDTNKKVDKMRPYLVGDPHSMYHLKHRKTMFVLCHYPMREWQWKEHGAIHCYGHVHSNEHRNGILAEPNSFHIGVDTNGLKPVNIDDVYFRFNRCGHDVVQIEEDNKGVCANCGKKVERCIMNEREAWV